MAFLIILLFISYLLVGGYEAYCNYEEDSIHGLRPHNVSIWYYLLHPKSKQGLYNLTILILFILYIIKLIIQ